MKYQDLVIKDGKFVGDFEKMYKVFNNPWNQDDEVYSSNISRRSVCHFIDKYQIKSIVEWGCGLGKTTNYIKNNTYHDIDIKGIDISQTAIRKAKERYPDIEFIADDLSNVLNHFSYECIFLSEITWYLLEDNLLDDFFKTLSKSSKGEKYLFHQLSFYKEGVQKYGTDYFTNIDEFIDFCPFDLVVKVVCELEDSIDTLTVFRF
ncbi:class I SAM-dependent methyltransferase [Pseudomonadales bacterium]|nr:class I SAM-dependent methyltransferase [Pseudomonadales bacterium]